MLSQNLGQPGSEGKEVYHTKLNTNLQIMCYTWDKNHFFNLSQLYIKQSHIICILIYAKKFNFIMQTKNK